MTEWQDSQREVRRTETKDSGEGSWRTISHGGREGSSSSIYSRHRLIIDEECFKSKRCLRQPRWRRKETQAR